MWDVHKLSHLRTHNLRAGRRLLQHCLHSFLTKVTVTSVLTQGWISAPVQAAGLCCLIQDCHDTSTVSEVHPSEKLLRRLMTVVSSIIGLTTLGWRGCLIRACLTNFLGLRICWR